MKDWPIYLTFILAFAVMHGLGVAVAGLPYILNALILFGSLLMIMLFVLLWGFKLTAKEAWLQLGFTSITWKGLFPGWLTSILLLLCYPLLGMILQTPITLTDAWLPNSLGLLLTGGLMEEMIFRGFVFGSFRKRMPFRKAVWKSMILFALAHLLLFMYMSWPIALMSLLLSIGISLPFAYLYEHAGRAIWGAALVHAVVRTIGMVVTTSDETYTTLALMWMGVSLIVPYGVILLTPSFRMLWKSNGVVPQGRFTALTTSKM